MKNPPPFPQMPNAEEQRRAEHQALRRRLIMGTYEDDLEEEMLRHFSADRYMALGPVDMSSNVLEQISRQLAVLYNTAPTVHHTEDISELTGADGYVTNAGLFPLMQQAQQFILAINETFVRIDVAPHKIGQPTFKPGLNYRIVTPDYVYCESSPDNPDEPIYYREIRLRIDPENDEPVYVADVLDIRNPEDPVFGMYIVNHDGTLGADVSEKFMGHPTHRGEDYPYRYADGRPFLPVELYHAQKTGLLWNTFRNSQTCYGSLVSSCLTSWAIHLIRDCSYPQRYVAGLNISGLGVENGDLTARRAAIATDPSSILMFYSDPENTGQPLVGQFEPGADPVKMFETIAQYEYKVATAAGLSSSVLKQTADIRSGFSLSVSRDGQRQASARYAPLQSYYDERLLAKSAALCNRFLGTNLPENNYRIQYGQVPQSPEEIKATREDVLAKLAAGLISPIDAMQTLNPGIDENTAREMLLKIKRERAELM